MKKGRDGGPKAIDDLKKIKKDTLEKAFSLRRQSVYFRKSSLMVALSL